MSDEIENDVEFPPSGGGAFTCYVLGRGGTTLTVQLEARNIEDVKWTDIADVASDAGATPPNADGPGPTIRFGPIASSTPPPDWLKFYLPPEPPAPRAAESEPQAERTAGEASALGARAEGAMPSSAPGNDGAPVNPPPPAVSGSSAALKCNSDATPRERGSPEGPDESGLDRTALAAPRIRALPGKLNSGGDVHAKIRTARGGLRRRRPA